MPARLPKAVVTGPPGSGKSTIAKLFGVELGESFRYVPEVPTLLITSLEATPGKRGSAHVPSKEFGIFLYQMQVLIERGADWLARSSGQSALLLDKGRVDLVAHFGGLLEYERYLNTSLAADYDEYDLVLCLGLPERDVYEEVQGNNPCRYHDYEDAKRIEGLIYRGWKRHSHYIFIPKENDWEEKVARVRKALRNFLVEIKK